MTDLYAFAAGASFGAFGVAAGYAVARVRSLVTREQQLEQQRREATR